MKRLWSRHKTRSPHGAEGYLRRNKNPPALAVGSVNAVKNGNLPEENQLRRTPEKTLITWAIFGGSLGAIIAMKKHRHKTLKPKFRYGIPAIIAIQIIALIAGVIVILQYNPDVFCSRFVELIGSLL